MFPVPHLWSLAGGRWNIPWPERLSQYDLVYLSPPDDPLDGLPIGNGDLGAMLWTEGSSVHLAINKVDTWDDGPDADFHNWASPADEDHQTTLRGCARLTLDLGLPFWDPLYLSDFAGGLRLADATAHLGASSPFGRADVSAYVSQEFGTLVVRVDTTSLEPIHQWVALARFGSRSFGHWFAVVNRDPSIGLAGTRATVEGRRIVIRQQLRTQRFVVAMALVPDPLDAASTETLHSRAARFAMAPSAVHGFTAYIAVVTSENADDPEAEAHRRLDRVTAHGASAVAARHADDWESFWSRSFVQLPDRYLANIWHLTLYLAGSSSRGASPPHFSRGLWTTNRDFMPWYFFFHWNTQWYLWPLDPADASELADPYLHYRLDQLPRAIDYAGAHGFEGALFVDVADRRGFQDLETRGNHTPGPQIAMDFWRHYQFTGDEAFLRERAYPLMRAVGQWYLGTIRLGDDGRYHPMPGNVYESFLAMEDAITDLAMIRALLPALAEAARILGADDIDPARLGEIVDRLADFHLTELLPGEVEIRAGQRVHAAGLGRGRVVASDRVFAAGFDPASGRWMRNRIAGEGAGYYGIPDPEFAPVFPAGVLGLKDRDTELFRAMVTQVRLHPFGLGSYVDPSSPTYTGGDGLCMGWCPVPIVTARLGLKDETPAAVRDHIELWQQYPQGLGHYGPYSINQRDRNGYQFTHDVHDAADAAGPEQSPDPARRDASAPDRTFPFAGWPFRHSSNEAMPIVATAVGEMLLQSHEGIVRLCPATPDDWEVAFTLVARGGFRVSAERAGGRISWVHVESRLGHRFVLDNPWTGAARIFVWEGPRLARTIATEPGVPIAFETRRGGSYLVGCDPDLIAEWRESTLEAVTNEGPRKLGQAILGKERRF